MRGMSIIVRTSSRIMIPLILILGANIIFHGHLTPGGGFQGGTIVAAALTLYALAYGVSLNLRNIERVEGIKSLGLALIGLVALAGALNALIRGFGSFMQNRGVFPLGIPGWIFSAGTLLPFSVGEGLNVAMGFMAVIFVYVMLMEFEVKEEAKR
jgi:multicomponent Na+:H+ antiporter subunit B